MTYVWQAMPSSELRTQSYLLVIIIYIIIINKVFPVGFFNTYLQNEISAN